MSSVSKDENLALSSEDSSSPDESELELGLGLSLSHPTKSHQYHHHHDHHHHNQNGSSYARIFTAKDFSSSPSSVGIGTKRPADSLDATNRPRFINYHLYFLFSCFVYFVFLGYYVT
jgi:auxin-responsive protein IAA